MKDTPEGTVVEEVADGCYAYLQLPGGWCVSNAGIITGDATTVVIDTAATEDRARALARAVAALARPPASTLIVNTHHHGDHTFGNSVFPGAPVLAHQQLRHEAEEAGHGLQQLFPDVTWGQVPLVLPTISYADRVSVDTGNHHIDLIHPPLAHTNNDTVVWLPRERVLYTGDIVMSEVTPFCLMGSATGMVHALSQLDELAPAYVVPGHGPTGGPELIHSQQDYFRWLLQRAAEGIHAGQSPKESASGPLPKRFAGWADSERVVANMHRAYADLTDQPVGILEPYLEMVSVAGGTLCCAA